MPQRVEELPPFLGGGGEGGGGKATEMMDELDS